MKLCTLVKYKRIVKKLKQGKYPKDVALELGITVYQVYDAVRYIKFQKSPKIPRQ